MLTFDCSRFWQLHLSCADKGLHISMEGNRINQSILMMDILGFLFLDFSKLERIGFIGASPWWNLSCLLEWVLSGLMQTIRRNFIKGGMIEISFRDLSFFIENLPLKWHVATTAYHIFYWQDAIFITALANITEIW